MIGGHHDNPRMGELVIFDPAKSRREADGAVQRISGYGQKVESIVRDGLTNDSWPKFPHPYPLSEKHFLVSCKLTPQSLWGINLVDLFDNLVLIKELPDHDSRVESKNTYQFGIHGYPMNQPSQPVVRVSWTEAMSFCNWLSEKTGERFPLPSEAQWGYACRAGTDTAMFYGDANADFSKFANMADAKLSEFASDPYTVDTPLVNPPKYDDWIPKAARFNDGALLTVAPGAYQPNASRLARLAAGGRYGFAQSLFQDGGNSGSALGRLLAAFNHLERNRTLIV